MFRRILRIHKAVYTVRKYSLSGRDRIIDTNEHFKKELLELNSYYPHIIDHLRNIDIVKIIPGLSERYKTLLDYTVNIGDTRRMSTCLLLLYSYKRLKEDMNINCQNLRQVYATAWALRMIEVSHIIIDDLVDHSDIRYAKPVWHKKESVEKAILDIPVLENWAYIILQNEIKCHPNYLNIINLFQNEWLRFAIGQFIDCLRIDTQQVTNMFKFRLEKGNYTLTTPIGAAMFLTNTFKDFYNEEVDQILKQAAQFTVIQNDYYGLYTSYKQFKKTCNDIPEGRNNWFYGKALELADSTQRKILTEKYGRPDEESIKQILDIYIKLRLDEVYQDFTRNYFETIHKNIEKLPIHFPKEMFHDVVDTVFHDYVNG